MRARGIVWLGTRTARFAEMRAFFGAIAGDPHIDDEGFAVWDLPNGDRLEVFGPGGHDPPYEDAPVAGFLVDDVHAARAELEGVGAEFIGPVHEAWDGNAWSHFRAPDGQVYEVTNRPDHPTRARPGALGLHMTRLLDAPGPAVFAALSEPETLATWWGPHGFTSPSIDFAPRVGQAYRITMQPPEGEAFHLAGEFREVEGPERLAYTFRWEEPDPDDRETLVTLALRDLGRSTEVVLTQGAFATEARRALHESGWTDSFERLAETLAAR